MHFCSYPPGSLECSWIMRYYNGAMSSVVISKHYRPTRIHTRIHAYLDIHSHRLYACIHSQWYTRMHKYV